jgi:hypothetical protein
MIRESKVRQRPIRSHFCNHRASGGWPWSSVPIALIFVVIASAAQVTVFHRATPVNYRVVGVWRYA